VKSSGAWNVGGDLSAGVNHINVNSVKSAGIGATRQPEPSRTPSCNRQNRSLVARSCTQISTSTSANSELPQAKITSGTLMACKGPTGLQVVVGGAVASTCSLMLRRLLAIVFRKVPFISGSNNP
jgi:hypothetical protein